MKDIVRTINAAVLSDGSYVVPGPAGSNVVDVVPGRPAVVAGTDRAPTVQLWELGPSVLLQVGSTWPVPEDEIRERLAALFPGRQLAGRTTRIQVPVIGTPRVTVRVRDDSAADGRRIIAESDTSGYPPFSVALTQSVDPDAATALRAALAGERGLAYLSYQAEISPDLDVVDGVLPDSGPLVLRRAADTGLTAVAICDLADSVDAAPSPVPQN